MMHRDREVKEIPKLEGPMDLFLLSFIDSMETYEQMNIKRRALVPG